MKILPLLVILFLELSLTGRVAADSDLCRLADQALSEASKIRQLSVKKAVPCKVQTKREVADYIDQVIREQLSAKRIRYESIVYKTLQLLPAEYDYLAETKELLLSQLAGYYEPKNNYFVMAGWLPNLVQLPTAVHEQAHALQDQHFVLDTFLDPAGKTTDQLLARAAVVEGDAMLVMNDYQFAQVRRPALIKTENIDGLVLQTVAGIALVPELAAAPDILKTQLLFPYTSGLLFAHQVLRTGGYSAVNKVYARLPQSTKEILHPEIYLKGGPAYQTDMVKFRKLAEQNPTDFIYQDVLGELVIKILFKQLEVSKADALLDTLAGDRLYLDVAGKQLFWHFNFSDPSGLAEFRSIFAQSKLPAVTRYQDSNNLIIKFIPVL